MAAMTAHEALIHIMVIAASADSKVSDRELEIISRLVNRSPVFETFDHSDLGQVAAQAIDLVAPVRAPAAAVGQRVGQRPLDSSQLFHACADIGETDYLRLRFLSVPEEEIARTHRLKGPW